MPPPWPNTGAATDATPRSKSPCTRDRPQPIAAALAILLGEPGADQADEIAVRLGGQHLRSRGNVLQRERQAVLAQRAGEAQPDFQRIDAQLLPWLHFY